ncbi:MAG: ribosome recycling factor [bacterium TMED46]|jgi:ribosome recycling factor|nr:MAG: ribosome recycling factor [bacterium TMED46]|tara:strand:+ start:4017 stop:4574 length:558 start_codon:yes stop_codon:yes gene_type:complete
MIEDILKDVKHRMEQAVNHTNGELNKVRTGRANPEMFNSLSVDYYGSMTPINQVSTISVPEPRLITLTPYEKTLIPNIEKAIMDANMGFTPGNNGTAVLVPVPPLSEERRQELNKFVHQLVEEGKIAIRNVRRDGIHHLHDLEKDGHISEDLIKDNEAEVQKITDDYIGKLDTLQNEKEKEILEV